MSSQDTHKRRIRVLLVDDSAMARSLLRELLERYSDLEIIGEAVNGKHGIELATQLQPDVICMDLEMPVLDGLAAIDHIMHSKAVPILVVSAQADAGKAYQALEAGALDIIAKPGLDDQLARELADKIRLLAGVSVITRIRRREAWPDIKAEPVPACPPGRNFRRLLAIACSTGGPQALAWLLPRLDSYFPAPVLISQHMSDGFVEGMVNWLGTLSALPVKVAEHGEVLRAGQVYVSPSESHMTVTPEHGICLQARQADDIYHPCCNLLLQSVARAYGPEAIGLIMTGMGRDGASGMLAMRQSGALTLAQDEASSVIFGMNQEAITLDAIDQILPLQALPERLNALVQEPS